MDRDRVWDHTVAARESLAATLATLSEDQWNHPSLCEGWRVRDVAAHIIAGPQLGWAATLRLVPGLWRGYNGMTLRDGRRRGDAPIAEILAQYDRFADVRRAPAVVTYVEPLTDALVHSQDILRPLGIAHPMPPEAAAVAATRARVVARLIMPRAARAARGRRFVATDTDWSVGKGRVVEGPAGELLMLITGRDPDWAQLSGPGVPIRTLGE
jgi:uncharacterized protein (TIGR03083 family)